jgi:hypothetical protein
MARRAVWRFAPVGLLLPSVTSSLGIDGGQIFQILASQSLGLSASAIGLAFGCGVLSLPVQIAASRFGLHTARRNLRLFVALASIQVAMLAALTFHGRTKLAVVALGITVLAEITLSVLFATSWQPLLSASLSTSDRQFMNSRMSAFGAMVLAGAVLLFASLHQTGRGIFLVTVAVVAAALAVSLRHLGSASVLLSEARHQPGSRRTISHEIRWLFAAIGLVNLAAMPLFVIYVRAVLWPEANLGIVAALQLGGSLTASVAWRTAERAPTGRACVGVGALAISTAALCMLHAPVTARLATIGVLAIAASSGAALTTTRLAIIELIHRAVDADHTVRVFTLLDVVASSSLQIGLAIAGWLVTFSAARTSWPLDPYRLALAITAGLAFVVTVRATATRSRATMPPR